MSRIDYFAVPLSTLQYVSNCEIIPGVLSDHAFVLLELELETGLRGPGLWKLNTTLLADKYYVDEVNKIIEASEKDIVQNVDSAALDVWEQMKYQIQQFS